MESKVLVLRLDNGEVVVGKNYDEEKGLIRNPVRYQVKGDQVFLVPFFGAPKEMSIPRARVIYVYEVDDEKLVARYEEMIKKSVIKVVSDGTILAS